jgi:pimeloyl-ACP methyl ester carboxylesterase
MFIQDAGSTMATATLTAVRPENPANRAAIVFVHGFTGTGAGTWTDLAPRIANATGFAKWDCWTVTYGTSWLPDVCGIWTADADLSILAKALATDLERGALARYTTLVLVAHSMGGLIVQKALVDSASIAKRTHTVVLFGTPSNGLVKALWAKLWKRQLDGMAAGGPFVTGLRADWTTKFGAAAPFSFLSVAGERDQFVPPESSLGPFAADQQAVISGNHVTMIHPPAEDRNVVDLLTRRIDFNRESGVVGDSALRAIELNNFNSIIPANLDDTDRLDDRQLVRVAIALDGVGRRDDAYRILARRAEPETDALGTMAGRLKRKWLLGRIKSDAEGALAHYAKAYGLANERNNLRQAYYHGINLAFLQLVYKGEPPAARAQAEKVLAICQRSEASGDVDEWVDATKGEANLILRNDGAAFAAYGRFVAAHNDPWKLNTTYLNARMIAAEFSDKELARKLGEIFGDPQPLSA